VNGPVERPLRLAEVLAETVHVYRQRVRAALALGALYTLVLAAAGAVHPVVYYTAASFMVVVTYGAATRLVAGDSFREAWAQVAVRLPVLAVLAFVVGVPFVLASTYLLLLILAALWLGLTGFAVPVAVTERDEARPGRLASVAYALERTVVLAKAEYVHAAGVAAALLLINFLVAIVLGGALVGFADNSRTVAALLAQFVLAPFFFLGLSVLYFDQRARVAGRAPPSA
jgi:hypothetical protein